MTDDAVDDAVAAVHVGEAGHGARSSTHFAEGALDDVGGAHLDPVRLRDGEKVQQSVEIALHTSHRVGAAVLPVLLGSMLAISYFVGAATAAGKFGPFGIAPPQ